MLDRKRFVPGIYNYCDRWCERCRYTDRCRVFRDSERQRARAKRRGADPDDLQSVLEDVSRNFEKAGRMLARWAKANDVDLDKLAAGAAASETPAEARSERDVDADGLVAASTQYLEQCHALLDALGPTFNQDLEEAQGRAGFMDVDAEARNLTRIRKAFDVVAWYHTMIHVKIRRAVGSRLEAEEERQSEEEREFHLSDAAGSASVARKGLIRSKAALTVIYDWDESLRDRIIDLLALAGRMQRTIEKTIPGVFDFVWPPPDALEEAGDEEAEE
jgi:hypothetical protein